MSAIKHLATPLYEHDCPRCTFLGTVFVPIRDYEPADMYKCNKSYIMRFSSDPADNSSGDHETLSFWFRTEEELFKKKAPWNNSQPT